MNSSILDKFCQIRFKPRGIILTPIKLNLQSWTSHEISLRVFPSIKKGNCGKGWQKYMMSFTACFLFRGDTQSAGHKGMCRDTKRCAGTWRGLQKYKIMCRDTEGCTGTQRRVQGQKVMWEDRKGSAGIWRRFPGHKERCGHTKSCWGTQKNLLSGNRRSLKFHNQTFFTAGAPQLFSQAVADVYAGAVPAGDLCCATCWHRQADLHGCHPLRVKHERHWLHGFF